MKLTRLLMMKIRKLLGLCVHKWIFFDRFDGEKKSAYYIGKCDSCGKIRLLKVHY